MTVLGESALSRRDFLKGTGALVVAFGVPLYLKPQDAAAAIVRGRAGPRNVEAGQLDSWLAVGADNSVTVFTGKVELGTGMSTTVRQIAAEELDVDWRRIEVVQGDTWATVNQGYTAGSQSTKTQWAGGLRQASVEGRRILLELAAKRLGVPASDLRVADGVVSVKGDPSARVTYGELVGGKRFNVTLATAGGGTNVRVLPKGSPKKPSEHTIVGQSVRRPDVAGRVTGEHLWIQNMTVPGMVHGRVVRQPGIDAKLVSVDGFPRRQPGLIRVVVKNDFVGVVAEREEQSIRAAQELRVTWDVPRSLPPQAQLYETMLRSERLTTRVLVDSGNVERDLAAAPKVVEAVYTHPYQMHAAMAPACAIADVRTDGATVWSTSQGVYQLRGALATVLGMEEHNVHCVFVEGTACYGLNCADDVAISAAILSQAVGRPVRLQYMRSDEHTWENYGNALVMELKAGLDDKGIAVWTYNGWTANRGGRPGPPGNLPAGVAAGFPEPRRAASPPTWPPLGPDSLNSTPPYVTAGEGTVEKARVVSFTVASKLFTGPLRSPSRLQNTFANESFMDELAVAAKADPVEFRLRHLADQRLIDVTTKVAELARWTPGVPPRGVTDKRGIARGRGIAIVQYETTDGYAAVVADVQVSRKTGRVRVTDVYVAQDCGILVNPDGAMQQVEGCVVQGVSRALKEEVKFNRSGVTSSDWRSYPVLRYSELPRLRAELINRPDQPAVGTGELVITCIAGAVGNAIFDATGARLRTLPFTPNRVKEALARA